MAENDHDHDHDGHDHDHDHGGTGDPAGDDVRALLAQQLLQLRPRDLLAQTAVMLANQAAQALSCSDGNCRFRDDHLVIVHVLGDGASSRFYIT